MQRERDSELVALARSGHERAFGRLVEHHQHVARRVALGMVGNDGIAQDLVQEAMLRVYLSPEHLRDDERFSGWLYGIVLNVCRSYIRDQKRDFLSWEALVGGLRFDAIHFSGLDPDPQEVVEARELHSMVLDAVNALSPKNREATLLFYYDQLSQQEISAILGISVVAVKGRLYKARRQLRERLLPVYLKVHGVVPAERRREGMVEVSVADVVRKKVDEGEHWIIVLLDEAGRRILPIWIGPYEGDAIALQLLEKRVPRPLTYDFMANLLEAAGAELVEVRVEALKENTFYAVAKLRSGDMIHEIDARPSDALNLALRSGSPIYAAEEVLQAAGIDIPEAIKMPELGKGLDSIKTEWKEKFKAAKPRPTKEQMVKVSQKSIQELIAFLFGVEPDVADTSNQMGA